MNKCQQTKSAKIQSIHFMVNRPFQELRSTNMVCANFQSTNSKGQKYIVFELIQFLSRIFDLGHPVNNICTYYWVWNDIFCKIHHILVISGRKQHHLAICAQIFLNSNGLVLVSLSSNHNISFIQNENFDFFQIEKFEFERPV